MLGDAVVVIGSSPLERVAAAQRAVRDAEEAVRAAVVAARSHGYTWVDIGTVLGTSRQAAFQRFGRATDPRTGEDMTVVLPDAAERAVAVLVELTEGRFEQARADFDERMTREIDAERLGAVWAQVAGSIGRYERMGTPFARPIGDYTTVDVPLHYEAGEVIGRVSFDRGGKVAGLFVLPPDKG